MSTTTSFPPKATTVGCGSDIHMNGYVYPAGPLAPGSDCFAPILEITNASCEDMRVRYASRTARASPETLANCVLIPPKAFVLLTGLLPSVPGASSKILVEDSCGGSECYTLEHDLEHGYDLRPLREGSCKPSHLTLYVSKDPYAPHFCGCQQPTWGNTVIVPARVKRTTCGSREAARTN